MFRRIGIALLACAFASAAFAQAQKAPASSPPIYEPTSGQEGKDVVWVPTPQVVVDKMLDMAKVTPNDFVMDLGSGDGRTVITAAKRGARALGVDQGISRNHRCVAERECQRFAECSGIGRAHAGETQDSAADE